MREVRRFSSAACGRCFAPGISGVGAAGSPSSCRAPRCGIGSALNLPRADSGALLVRTRHLPRPVNVALLGVVRAYTVLGSRAVTVPGVVSQATSP
jgi:hypothetical protein